jgi:glycosyltransferase involved in cell wall biosynthesis
MQRLGHSVKVLTYGLTETDGLKSDGDSLYKEYWFQGVPVISIRHRTIPEEASFTIFDTLTERMIEKILAKEDFDVVHVCHPMRVGPVIRVAKRKNIPVILSLTDFWLMCPKGITITNKGGLCQTTENGIRCVNECYGNFWKDRLVQRINEANEVFKTVDCVVSATYFLKRIFEFNQFTSTINIIPYGTDYNYIRRNTKEYSKKSEITIGFLSTLIPHKGAHVLLEAFNIASMENIRLKIYGHYFDRIDYYKTLTKMVKGNKRVEFLGEYKYEQVPELFNMIDLLAVPSIWWENSPLILLSALAHNVPAIVSDLGGMTEVVRDGENAFTFEVGNAASLAIVLRQIGKNPAILNNMKNRICHPPRIEEEAFEYENIYTNLLKKRLT